MGREKLSAYTGHPCLVFPASCALDVFSDRVLVRMDGFFPTWESHGSKVDGVAVVLENRFLLVAHRPQEISGCSRDALLFFVKDIGKELSVEWLGASRVFYRKNGVAIDVERNEFKRRVRAGVITPDTVVFDTTIRETDAFLQGRFEMPAKLSWHRHFFQAEGSLAA